MNKFKNIFLVIILSNIFYFKVSSQTEKIIFTLDDVISHAKKYSPEAIMARHSFRASYWEYRTHTAHFLPTLNLNSSLPGFYRSKSEYKREDGSYTVVEDNESNFQVGLSLEQNIALTGGTVFIKSDLNRKDLKVISDSALYITTPLDIGFYQPIRVHNEMHWDKKIEPLKYEKAKKELINKLEEVSIRAINSFFSLASAQVNLEIAKMNYANADTLYKITKGRHNIGTVAENDLLQMELNYLKSELTFNRSLIDLQSKKYALKTFLGYNEKVDIEIIIPDSVPQLQIDYEKAMSEAIRNNPDWLSYQIELLESDRGVAKAKSEKGLNANLSASFGLRQTAPVFSDAYTDLPIKQEVNVNLELPIIDWGLGKKNYNMAKSMQEVTRVQIEQARIAFEQNVFMEIMIFNLQNKQFTITAKADTVARKNYEVVKHRFLIGKIDVLDLNNAITEKDMARQSYINALNDYWKYYYNIRKLTLFDWLSDQTLSEEFDALIEH